MRPLLVPLLVSLSAVPLSACSGTDAPDSSPGDVPTGVVDLRVAIPPDEPGRWNVVSPEFVVQPGEDKMVCQYLQREGGTIGVNELDALQAPGGHHVLLLKSPTPKPVGTVEDCTENFELLPWVFPLGLPEGHAFRVEDGEPFVLQAHYVNTLNEPILVRDVASMVTLEEAEVQQWAAPLTLNTFEVAPPPRADSAVSFDCELERDVDLFLVGGHMHEYGSRFDLTHFTASGAAESVYLASPWEPDFRDTPPVAFFFERPRRVAAGDRLRVTCQWQNPLDTALGYPNEMCTAFGMLTGTTEDLYCEQTTTPAEVVLGPDDPEDPGDFAAGPPGSVTFRFAVSEGVRQSPNLMDTLQGAVYGNVYRKADVALTGPVDGAEAAASIEVANVDVQEAELSGASWVSQVLEPGEYVFLGFFDLDGNGEQSRDPDAGDAVTLPTVNVFEMRSDSAAAQVVRFDLVFN